MNECKAASLAKRRPIALYNLIICELQVVYTSRTKGRGLGRAPGRASGIDSDLCILSSQLLVKRQA